MKKKSIKKRLLKWSLRLLLLIFIICIGFYFSVYLGFFGKIPSQSELKNLSQLQASQVFDKNEKLIGKFFITDREIIKFEEIPQDLIHALLATEDIRFYKHNGIDYQSLFRVFFKTILLQKKSSGGGSTLTLQLAKNIYGRKNYNFLSIPINKLRESIVAQRLEKIYSKDEILTLYLNTVPFSGDTYGIESASQKFFNQKAKDLSLSQAAVLIGTLKANHTFNPRLFPDRSYARKNVVLGQMLKYNFLSPEEAEVSFKINPEINYRNNPAPYFNEQIKREVERILSEKEYHKPNGKPYKLKEDGLKIYTTLDAGLQQYAQEAMREHLMKLQQQIENAYGKNPPWHAESEVVKKAVKKLPAYQELKTKKMSEQAIWDSLSRPKKTELFGWKDNQVKNVSTIDSLRHYLKFLNAGIVSVDPSSGAIVTYVGGIDYRYFQYDHIVQSKRQVGSTFKPFVYAAGLENGLKPCDYFPVKEITYTDQNNWTPKNVNRNIEQDLSFSVSEALTQSLNTISVKLLREVGAQQVVDQVRKLGISENIQPFPSIALGVSEIRMIDMAKAYTAFVNDGRPKTPYMIKRIEDQNGNLIFKYEEKPDLPQAFSDTTRQQMLEMLKNIVNQGTAQRLRNVYGFKNDLAGKTGTTQDNKDGWFVGLMPGLVTVVWVGNDDSQIRFPNTALGQGANSALPIFAEMLKKMNADSSYQFLTSAKFKIPSDEILASLDCPPSIEEKEGFFKRLFGKDKTEKDFQKKSKEKKSKKNKKGFFKRLFGGKKEK